MPEPLAKHMTALVNNSNSCTATFVQMAGEAALTGPQDDVLAMLAEFRARRDVVVSGLNAVPGVTCTRPAGAFYAFPRIDAGLTSVQLANQLLEQAGVVTIPGTGFGAEGEGHLRISYANSRENLREGIRRMAEHLAAVVRR
jgi:aspartate/methionine/tyrosine aminotransferase